MPRWTSSDKRHTALVIDDEQDIVTIIKKALDSQANYKVEGFSDPSKAVEHFGKNRDKIDLVITDARMPQMSGFEVARKVKQLNPDVKVVLISAFEINKPEFEKVMPHTPIDNFIAKPFHVSQLLQVVDGL